MADGNASPAVLPLTQAQLGVLQGQQMAGDHSVFHAGECFELEGPLDVSAFTQALNDTLLEASALHLGIVAVEGGWQQRIARPTITPLDVRARECMDAAALNAEMAQDLARPFALDRGPLFEHVLYRLGPQRHCWFHRAHHLLLDGYGFNLVARRVAARYSALLGATAPAANPFTDLAPVVAADVAYQQSPAREADRVFWLRTLDGLQPMSLCPATVEGIGRGCRLPGRLPAEGTRHLESLAQARGLGVSELLMAGFAAYLAHHGHGRDVVLGLPVMQRLGTPALRTPCTAMNVMPLPLAPLPSQDLPALAMAVRARIQALRPHSRYRFEHLEGDLEHAGYPRGLLATEINVMPFEPPAALGACRMTPRILAAGPVEDLAAIFTARNGAIGFDLEGRPGNYTTPVLAGHAQAIGQWVATWAQRPQTPFGDLP